MLWAGEELHQRFEVVNKQPNYTIRYLLLFPHNAAQDSKQTVVVNGHCRRHQCKGLEGPHMLANEFLLQGLASKHEDRQNADTDHTKREVFFKMHPFHLLRHSWWHTH